MSDIVDAATRSRMMSGIRGKDTKPEFLVRRAMHARGFRYRLHASDLPGKPDMVLPKYHAVIFVHGCFWHGHSCPLFKWPKSRPEFWRKKIEANVIRDQKVIAKLVALGWRVAVIWECALRGKTNVEPTLDRLALWLRSDMKLLEVSAPALQKPMQCPREGVVKISEVAAALESVQRR